MQTFLPYPEFDKSAYVLDNKRLGKQRVECKQIYLEQFPNHPCTLMWRDYKSALLTYAIAICEEWVERDHNDSLLEWFKSELIKLDCHSITYPRWLGFDLLHASHRSQLLSKQPDWYKMYKWAEPAGEIPYFWPAYNWRFI